MWYRYTASVLECRIGTVLQPSHPFRTQVRIRKKVGLGWRTSVLPSCRELAPDVTLIIAIPCITPYQRETACSSAAPSTGIKTASSGAQHIRSFLVTRNKPSTVQIRCFRWNALWLCSQTPCPRNAKYSSTSVHGYGLDHLVWYFDLPKPRICREGDKSMCHRLLGQVDALVRAKTP